MTQFRKEMENSCETETPLRYYDIFQCLHELFLKQASLLPGNPAVLDSNDALNYEELNELSNRIALAIVQQGIVPGSFVGLCASRSLHSVAGMVGILKAGCAWVPLDADYPVERLRFIAGDAELPLILTLRRFRETFSFRPVPPLLFIDELPPESSTPQAFPAVKRAAGEAAYVIYTSGTTGNPKGVCCHHQGVVNLLDDFQQRRTLGSGDRCSWWTTPSFDVSVYEIFSALLAGSSLVIVPDHVRTDSAAFMEWLHEQRITSAYLPPMMIADFAEWVERHPGESAMRRLLTGVEPIPSKLMLNLQRDLPRLTIINGYGPTETTVCATLCTVDPETLRHETTPIGKAVQNMRIHLLDDNGAPVATGQTGEIYIGGIGVSLGYLNRPELNDALFLPDPEHREEGRRIYRTGDLAFQLPDGNLLFAGRKDSQFKYMGYRIESGEIEAVLKRHEAITEAVVMLREDEPGLKKIVAYCVADSRIEVTPRELHAFAESSLPAYMIPAAFVFLPKIPMTPNGKSDRKALPPPERGDYETEGPTTFAAPQTDTEQELAALFSTILGIGSIGVEDNFFAFGGHSLLATRLCAQIRTRWSVDIPLAFVFDHPTVKEIASEIERKEIASDAAYAIAPTGSDRAVFPASATQQGVWLYQQYQPEGTLFNIPVVVYFTGPLRSEALRKSVDFLVARHSALRTVFELEEEELVQRVLPSVSVELTTQDLSGYPEKEKSAELAKVRAREGRHRFELEKGPLVKFHLVTLGKEEFQLFLTFHHLVIDGWGASVFFQELAAACEAFSEGKTPDLPANAISYGDFSLWQRERMGGPLFREQLRYWTERLHGASFIQNIPYDFSKPSAPSFSGARCAFSIPPEIMSAVGGYCQENSCTPFMYLMTAFQILLQRYTGSNDIVTGTTIANRNHPDTGHLVGLLTNTLAIRTTFTGQEEFAELLRQVRKASLEAFDNQDLPFEVVAEAVAGHRERGHHPVFQHLFILQNTPEPFFHAGAVDFMYEEIGNGTAKLDFLLNVEVRKGALVGWIEYNTTLFHGDTIGRIASDYVWIASHAFENSLPVSAWKLPSIPASDQYRGKEMAIGNVCCHQLFERQATRTPERIAVRCDDLSLSYRELNEEANRIARRLIRRGVAPGASVGLCLQRNAGMIAGMLGILKAGGCYVPLDSSYPKERIHSMASDSGIRLALADAHTAQALEFDSEIELVLLDRPDDADETAEASDNPATRTGAEDTAYIMYTSGTSGKPKGIMVPHRGVANLALAAAKAYGVTGSDTVLQFFTVSFDGSVEEIFMTLAAGATLVIRTFDPAIAAPDFLAFIESHDISVIDLPTAFWKELAHGVTITGTRIPGSLRAVVIGGEQASVADYKKWREACGNRIRVINTYGPTECTVVSVCCDPETISPGYDESRGLPIGKPLANTRLCVVDGQLRPVPFGMPGELLIGGAGVAKGYLDLPELTAERFIDDLFHEHPTENRLYRTGDIVRSLPDGNLQFLGRRDNQVKIRGFRIEPGEIESVLNQHEQIRQSAVIELKNDQGQSALAAYFVSEPKPLSPADLRLYLARKLPEYMVPAYFIQVEKIPLLPNGKLDRSALPKPGSDIAPERARRHVAPGSEIETALVEIWEEVLGVRPIGITDNFFELGGHSLLAVRLCSIIQKKTGKKVTLSGLFQSLTIEKLARKIDSEEQAPEASPAVCIRSVDGGASYPPLFFIHILGTGLKFCRPAASHLSPELPVWGLSIHLLEEYPAEGFSVEEVAKRYVREAQRIQPQGPYLFAGISLGGLIALEMARELRNKGEDVRLVALIDTNAPGVLSRPSAGEKMRQHRERFRQAGLSYLIEKSAEVLRYKWLTLVEKSDQLYTRTLLRLYAKRHGGAELPVFLKEFIANNQNDDALFSYQPQPFNGDITLFKSEEQFGDANLPTDPRFGWGAVVSGNIEVIHCKGHHFTMLADPHAETLAKRLMQAIDRSLQTATPVERMPRDGIVIRAVERGDSELFRDVSLRSISESPDAFVATLDQARNEPPAYWTQLLEFIVDSPLDAIYLALHGQRCIGFTAARIDSNDPALAHLRWMWVESGFRGKGVGARLLDTAIEWANSKGARAMELQVSENQTAAIRLYESKGFSDTGETGSLRPGSAIRARKMVRVG